MTTTHSRHNSAVDIDKQEIERLIDAMTSKPLTSNKKLKIIDMTYGLLLKDTQTLPDNLEPDMINITEPMAFNSMV